MSEIAIKFENISKLYRLGEIGTGTLSHDLNRWCYKVRGLEDPYLKIGETNDRSLKGQSDYIWALRDINLEVKKGEVLGIIGKNGAGKSTLLKLLSKVTRPTTGIIKSNGRIASLLEVGTGFHPEMTGRENVYMNGSIMGMTKAEIKRKFEEIVDFAGVERYIDTPVKRYSSGMTVRLGFAIAAHLEPEILVVDEVLAVGDAEFQKKAVGKMQDVSHSDGRIVLFVSHNLLAIKQLCVRGIVLTNGKVSFSGNSEEAVQNYLLESNTEKKITNQKYDVGNYPEGDIIKLHEYALLNSENKKIDKFNLYEEVKIELVFEVKQKGFSSFPNLHFFNQQDQYLFVISTDNELKIQNEGVYKTIFNINAYTFNVGIFKVGIAITCYPGMDVQFYVNPAITFEVEESNVELRRNPYIGVMPGEFRPQMQSKTTKLSL
jgi:lipopolysaccharide transport system ATP-binding protein